MAKKTKRTKMSCVFYGTPKREPGSANCRLTTYKVCDPDRCPWYKDKQMMAESFERARQNYIKAHGSDDYYALGYGPRNWRGQKQNDWEKEDEANARSH